MCQVLKASVKSCVIDGEAVAWDSDKGEILPFQVLSTRKRKDATEANITVQVCVFAFDLLYLNDRVSCTESWWVHTCTHMHAYTHITWTHTHAYNIHSTHTHAYNIRMHTHACI